MSDIATAGLMLERGFERVRGEVFRALFPGDADCLGLSRLRCPALLAAVRTSLAEGPAETRARASSVGSSSAFNQLEELHVVGAGRIGARAAQRPKTAAGETSYSDFRHHGLLGWFSSDPGLGVAADAAGDLYRAMLLVVAGDALTGGNSSIAG